MLRGQAKRHYGQGGASWKGLAEFSGGPCHRLTSLWLCPQPEEKVTGHPCVVLFPQPRPPSHSVAKNENGVSCSGWVGGRVSFTQIHRAVSGTCIPGTFRAEWRKEAVSELPIMEPGGSLALKSPHLSILSPEEPGDNWVLCVTSKTQGPFSTTVPRECPFFFFFLNVECNFP